MVGFAGRLVGGTIGAVLTATTEFFGGRVQDPGLRKAFSSGLASGTPADQLNQTFADIEAALTDLGVDYVPPETEGQKRLAEIWETLLGVQGIGLQDSFFHRGGNSLLGIQLISRIRETFQVELPLRLVFAAPTVAELTEWIEAVVVMQLRDYKPEAIREFLLEGLEDS